MPLADVRIRPPVPKPTTIDCMAVNYMEDGTRDAPAQINAFHKSPGAVIGHNDTMILPDVPAAVFEGEAELAAIVGKPADNIDEADAMDHVFGWTCFIDGSARALPPPGNTFFQVKSRKTFAPIGPWIVTKDEIADPQNLQVKLWNNGDLMQNFNTDDMAHKIPRCISRGCPRSTRWCRATSWPPAPTTAASTRSRTATGSSWRSRESAGLPSTSATTSSAAGTG